ncbi:hypothetical protein [Legionella micdadei]|uniref:Uncharacterized protein n=1 Tax=Legionella micdadei TaxID=451 RepID=A0A098GG11_LEGMI|nr:hypothetical protein [Legionella micdadei]ARG97520.1 hypothetical protein B6N58_07485 [Legionella micdadei]ARH00170.1 hypothetical protein B6V88_06935 [Legionella micdadei]KTD27593.1 hypothetical protein Lmic_1913 [Legionella micdadei]NSL19654.1 hypothetical protein [Legionella micdadei]CEG60922.1 protein of unknown function [Legionella micdadei]
MFSRYAGDMGIDLSPETQNSSEEKIESTTSSPATSETQTEVSQTHSEVSESSIESSSTSPESTSSENSGFTFEDYCDTDYNQTAMELEKDYGHLPSFYESNDDTKPSSELSKSEKNHDSFAVPKFVYSSISSLISFVVSPFSGSKTTVPSPSEQSSKTSTVDVVPEPQADGHLHEKDYFEHQKDLDSPNKIIIAMMDTVHGAATTSREDCENHEFKCKEREKLHKKTGGPENTEMAQVNVYLDRREKALLPGARKKLKKHAETKQQAQTDTAMAPSDAIYHARKEGEIAYEFGKGDDHYDKAGSLIHSGKKVMEMAALDLYEGTGGVTNDPGFVEANPIKLGNN